MKRKKEFKGDTVGSSEVKKEEKGEQLLGMQVSFIDGTKVKWEKHEQDRVSKIMKKLLFEINKKHRG